MKKNVSLMLISVVVVCIAGAALSGVCVADEGKILVIGEEFPPFEFERNGEPMGIDVDIVRYIFNKMNIKCEVKLYPWMRAWKMIEKGDADAVFSTSRKEKRMPYLFYPKEDMWTSEYLFFVRKDKKKPSFNGYADAKGLNVGIIRGNSYHESFWKADLTTKPAVDAETNFRRLFKGYIDLFPIDKTIGLYTMGLLQKKDNVPYKAEITYYDHTLFSKGYPMPFARKSANPKIKEIADQFEQELIKIKANGVYDEIVNKWLK